MGAVCLLFINEPDGVRRDGAQTGAFTVHFAYVLYRTVRSTAVPVAKHGHEGGVVGRTGLSDA